MEAERPTCSHDQCTCPVEPGIDHCGPSCRMGIVVKAGDPCACGHAACKATTGSG